MSIYNLTTPNQHAEPEWKRLGQASSACRAAHSSESRVWPPASSASSSRPASTIPKKDSLKTGSPPRRAKKAYVLDPAQGLLHLFVQLRVLLHRVVLDRLVHPGVARQQHVPRHPEHKHGIARQVVHLLLQDLVPSVHVLFHQQHSLLLADLGHLVQDLAIQLAYVLRVPVAVDVLD